MKHNVVSLENKVVGEVDLSEALFGEQERIDILAKVVRWQLAKKRAMSRATKGISDVRGTIALSGTSVHMRDFYQAHGDWTGFVSRVSAAEAPAAPHRNVICDLLLITSSRDPGYSRLRYTLHRLCPNSL